ncbi:MAG TPA: RNA 2',3'-cyclic phosphodiesterase [Bryobacteraceae bacterium]|jgi:2'-5' RNA ligase
MRLFVAIDIPAEIKTRLRAFVDRLRPTAKLSWSPVDNLHVTTKFIGEWPETRLSELKEALASLPKPGKVDIGVRGLGWFPNAKNPRVFWAGIEAGESLKQLAEETERRLAALGVPVEERGFHPHLTLARRRDPVPLDNLRQALARQEQDPSHRDFGSFSAESFVLYLSAGGKYTKLQEFPLIN